MRSDGSAGGPAAGGPAAGGAAARWTAPRVGLLVVAVVLVGLNLRAPIVGVPPLIPALSEELSLTGSAAGLLTSLPLLCFAVVSPLVVLLVRAVGVDRSLLLSLLLLCLATALRPWGSFGLLLAGTALVGVAITVGNVLVPIAVRRGAGLRTAAVMAASTSSYGVGQGVAAMLAVPVANQVGWRSAMALLAVPAAVAAVGWTLYSRRRRGVTPSRSTAPPSTARSTPTPATPPPAAPPPAAPPPAAAGRRHTGRPPVWRVGDAWWLALFFGLQAALFYSASTWLPALLTDETGTTDELAGTALSLFHLIGIAGTLVVPLLLRALGGAVRTGVVVAVAWCAFFVGVAVVPGAWPVLVVLGGLAQGAGIGLGMTLIALRPVDADYGRGLSALVQSAGYAVAAVGPVALGWVHGTSGSWALVMWLCAAGAVVMMGAALRAGAERPIGASS
ncbi:MFS transporter [Georgenia sp. EYE_87]|uniref:MFS transporter n=1 Tax=Georgenia sp. EYE_87 TaxID=2853448 RepID=UPI00200556F1|nr:MFS transporter [Georgenia sp. EYE_87]MCK6209192.1 MFS transporter [Georgenia sp. EYE_87]